MIWEQYQKVEQQMKEALKAAGRPEDSARLLAVSKTKPLEMIEELAAHGVAAFGENKVQELSAKQEASHYPDLEWHLIGHLQRNKVRQLLRHPVALIHSVDSQRLAIEIEKEAARLQQTVSILIEVNIGQEESKTGTNPQEAMPLAQFISEQCPHLKVQGLMCVAPERDHPEEVRPYFRRMRQLRDEINARQLPGVCMKELSMGMSGDYRVAIEEGATIIRVGTAIFGARDYGTAAPSAL